MKGKIFNAQEVQAIIAGNKTMFREVIKTCKQHPNNVCRKVRNAHYGLNLKEDGLFWQPYGGSELQPFPYCDGKLSASTSLDEFCPYQVGQRIFVKESWVLVEDHLDYETGREWSVREWEGSLEEAQAHLKGDARFGLKASVYYPADGEDENPSEMHDTIGIGGKILSKKEVQWRSPKSMPGWATRLTLEVTNIRVERLDDITEEDCLKEGVSCHVGSEIADTGDYFDNEYWFGDLEEFKCNNCNTSGMDIGGCDECVHAQPHTNTFTNAHDPFINYWNATHRKPEEKFEAYPFVWVVDFKIIN